MAIDYYSGNASTAWGDRYPPAAAAAAPAAPVAAHPAFTLSAHASYTSGDGHTPSALTFTAHISFSSDDRWRYASAAASAAPAVSARVTDAASRADEMVECWRKDCTNWGPKYKRDFATRDPLPTCREHRAERDESYRDYKSHNRCIKKNFGWIPGQTLDQQISRLQGRITELESEHSGRVRMMNLIKPKYQDDGHRGYTTKLEDQITKMKRTVSNLESQLRHAPARSASASTPWASARSDARVSAYEPRVITAATKEEELKQLQARDDELINAIKNARRESRDKNEVFDSPEIIKMLGELKQVENRMRDLRSPASPHRDLAPAIAAESYSFPSSAAAPTSSSTETSSYEYGPSRGRSIESQGRRHNRSSVTHR